MVEFHLNPAGFLEGPGLKFPASYGRAGISRLKQEGDGATPTGSLRLLRVLYRADREKPPLCVVPIEPVHPADGWCDDPAHPSYNQQVTLPFAASHEALHRTDNLYDIIGVLDWNIAPTIKHRGSAIFLHIATQDYEPTAGCIALSPPHLRQCLAAGLSMITAA
ncbi:MAG: hypothetical protein B7Z75_07630 [Acidocella sp. 20-57-95]|nr:MAG: hypothetical protein B7Z75_07630 [Acidocella sp. 20-57-95]OYV59543.1 MAG: hypothetical protein B7Z71_07840 [Acidocella sp. 21-58-7]HQT62917.1 L,D-transpeptidase family protein [Acidocella sp.]HQU05120.1 L,D-transpeptidase family protein [Acidocella sp.]